MIQFILAFSFLLLYESSSAQDDWQPAGTLYSDSYVTVVLEYDLNPDYCPNGVGFSRYRYNIKGRSRGSDYYISWCMDFQACNGDIICQTNNLNIGRFDDEGPLEDLDYTFNGATLETAFYDVTTGYSPKKKKPFVKPNPKLLDPTGISGTIKIKYGETTNLSVTGGNLSKGAKWVWYEGQCGGKVEGNGASITITPRQKTTYFVRGENATNKTETICVSATVEVDADSEPADDIMVKRLSCTGDKTLLLSVSGGHLGQGAEWIWYEGSCNSNIIGKGPSIQVLPAKKTIYYVQAHGNTNTTNCRSITADLQEDAIDPISISGPAFVCGGNSVQLQVMGGHLATGQQWTWYSNSIQPSNKVGTGNNITVHPAKSGSYLVRGEGPCGSTAYRSLIINVGTQSVGASGIYGGGQVYKGKKITLTLSGGSLGEGADWVWYRNNCSTGKKLGRGNQLSLRVRKKQTVYVRAEGKCGTTSCASTALAPLGRFIFLNAGYVAGSNTKVSTITGNPFSDSLNFMVTLGSVKSTGWYIRGKFNIRKRVTTLYECDNLAITNYNATASKFTKFNGLRNEDRFALSAGMIMGRQHFFYYGGLGYGQRKISWGFDEFSQSTGLKVNTTPVYAKNTQLSAVGLEIEAGLLLRLSFLNIIGGISGILDAQTQNLNVKYIDMHLGIGLSF